MTLCSYCLESSFVCPDCLEKIELSEVVDIFHVGQCLNCQTYQDVICPDRLEKIK